jgi:hypothetical protein
MKKILTILVAVTLVSSVLSAQGVYIRAGAGYGLPLGTTSIGEKYLHAYSYLNAISTNTYSTESVSASYGAGTNFNFALGYKFNENFIFDLGVQYLAGRKFEVSNIYTDTQDTYSGKDELITTTKGKGLFFSPSLIFSVGFGKGAPYGKIGFITGSPMVSKNESSYYDLDGTSSSNKTWEYGKGLALGFQTAVGMNWKLSEKLDIFTELNFVSMTYYAKEGNLVKSSLDGVDNLAQLNLSQKQTLFKKNFDPSVYNDGTLPLVALRQASPFSSLSVQAGLRFTLWKKSE